jgi:zinc transport system ATP-binding protein
MREPLLSLREVGYSTPLGRPLAENINVTLYPGQVLLVSGPNGCGKSTLLKVLLQRAPIDAGEVDVHVPEYKVAYIPQLENTDVHLPFTLRDVLDISVKGSPVTSEIRRIGLLSEDQLEAAWNTASGGERKRTLLTRALLQRPSLLLFDEPMNHLDVASRRIVIKSLAAFLSAQDGPPRAAVLVCHKGLHDEEKALFDTVYLNFGGAA